MHRAPPLTSCTTTQLARLPGGRARVIPPTPPGLAFQPFGRAVVQNPTVGEVVLWMRRFAHQGKADPAVRGLVEEITRELVPGDYASEVLACYYWVCGNVRYLRDPAGLEYVTAPQQIIQGRRVEDCESMATLLAAMVMACGNQAAFCICSFAPDRVPSHAFCMVLTPGGWLPLDPVANRVTADMGRRVTWKEIIPVGADPGAPAMSAAPIAGPPRTVPMTYSVWDYHRSRYDYYRAPGHVDPTGSFRPPLGGVDIPERVAAQLPPGAVRVGAGAVPRGRIAIAGAALGRLTGGRATAAVDGSGGGVGGVNLTLSVGQALPPWAALVAALYWWWKS